MNEFTEWNTYVKNVYLKHHNFYTENKLKLKYNSIGLVPKREVTPNMRCALYN